MTPFRAPHRHQSGLSLVETLIASVVTAVAVGSALPGIQGSIERRHLDGAAAQLETDLQFARSLAVAQNRTLRVSFSRNAAGSCYVVHTGAAGACQCSGAGAASCTPGDSAMRTVRYAGNTLQLSSNVNSMVLDPGHGTVTPTATLRVQGQAGHAVHLVVNIMGRVRACTPTAGLSGYEAC